MFTSLNIFARMLIIMILIQLNLLDVNQIIIKRNLVKLCLK